MKAPLNNLLQGNAKWQAPVTRELTLRSTCVKMPWHEQPCLLT
jgi:hypothetical protein